MINKLHLLWIIPLCLILGGMTTIVIAAKSVKNVDDEIEQAYQQGLKDGMDAMQ